MFGKNFIKIDWKTKPENQIGKIALIAITKLLK